MSGRISEMTRCAGDRSRATLDDMDSPPNLPQHLPECERERFHGLPFTQLRAPQLVRPHGRDLLDEIARQRQTVLSLQEWLRIECIVLRWLVEGLHD
jgi:hypothetical protein